MSSITLSSSIRANLLSLQNTTKLLDLTSGRLSTGLKVNSALDNPGSFFTARSLTNRASDLNARKDSIGQGISLLEATDKSLTSITSLVEQAKAKAQQADEAATGGITSVSSKKATTVSGVTTISTDFSSSATADTVGLTVVGLTTGATLTISVNGNSTSLVEGAATAGSTIAELVTAIDALNSVSATYNTTSNEIDITADGGTDIGISGNGFAGSFGFKADGTTFTTGATQVFATANAATDLLQDVFGVTDAATLVTTVTGGGVNTFTSEIGDDAEAKTIQDLLDAINLADTALTATYNTTTSKVDVKAAEGVAVKFSGEAFSPLAFNDGTNDLVANTSVTYSKLGSETEVGALTTDFQSLLDQINALISDASYKGKNLLKGGATIDIKFNVVGDSKLTIAGKTLEADSDGILSGLTFTQKATDYDFTTAGDITAALADVDTAITELRSIASTFGTSLGIIQTREDFTIGLVNALESGAGKLVNASLEEESAKLLALQTRQALGIQSLAIANTSQQSILALFR